MSSHSPPASDTGTVSGTVSAVNDAPVAVDDSFTVAEDGTSAALNLTGNDTDVDLDTLSVLSIGSTTLTPGTAQSISVTNGTFQFLIGVSLDASGLPLILKKFICRLMAATAKQALRDTCGSGAINLFLRQRFQVSCRLRQQAHPVLE